MRRADDYRHLNKESKIQVDLEDVAAQVVHMNYGVHRLLSAIIRKRIEEGTFDGRPDELMDGIVTLLDKGLY